MLCCMWFAHLDLNIPGFCVYLCAGSMVGEEKVWGTGVLYLSLNGICLGLYID